MAEDDFLKGLVQKALVSAASAAGSKIGGAAASYVLDILGLGGNNDLDEIKDALNTISDQVKKTDSKLSALMDEIKWQNATDSFDSICAAITTHGDNIQTLLNIPDDATRDAQIKQYILTAHPPIDELDTSLTLINNRIMGKSGGITGTYNAPLMKTYLDTHWATVWDKSAAKSYANILAVYLQGAQMQRLATTLLVAYREANNQIQLANSAKEHIESRLAAQLQVMIKAVPDFVALNSMISPGLELHFTDFQIAPAFVRISSNNYLTPASVSTPYFYWRLNRIGADPTSSTYTLGLLQISTATEDPQEVTVSGYAYGDPPTSVYVKETAYKIKMVQGNVSYPVIFSIEATDQHDVYRFRLADGRTLGHLDRGYAGHLYEWTSTEATATNGVITLNNLTKVLPYAPQPKLSAWSRAFSATSNGEGHFTKGYRVRYRVTSINRFGESAKSDWLLAPKSEDSQDSVGYFGNQTYYFPQILLFDPTGLTEAYRIFRQFQGGAEEEVTAGGTFTDNPQSGKPIIFDDFTL